VDKEGPRPLCHDRTVQRPPDPGKLFVTVGLPASGKTTRARELAAEFSALRLTPDDWMIPLFNHNDADGKRDVLEGRFIWLAMRALEQGINVVLDFGVWGKDERSALKYLASQVGAECELVYLPIESNEQLRRVNARFAIAPGTTFVMTEDDLAKWRGQFQEPDPQELHSSEPGPVPEGFASWEAWTVSRWPTSIELPKPKPAHDR
jgi:predicted kinase